MYAKKNNDRKVNINTFIKNLGPLNYDKSIFLVQTMGQSNSNKKRYLMKVIAVNHENAAQIISGQQNIVKKLFSSSMYYFKPDFYDLKDNCLFIIMKLQPLSLQHLLWIYKFQQKNLSSAFVREFTVRNFEGIARLKQSDIFPQNLKPSNIFLEIRSADDRAWMWGEAGLYTNKICPFYYKQSLQGNAKGNRVKADPFEMQFYSLAIILLEMITFQPLTQIDKIVRQGSPLYKIKNFQAAQNYYGQRLTNIITLLINPPKDNTLNKAIQAYKQSNQEEDNEEPNYGNYELEDSKLEEFIVGKLLENKLAEVKQKLVKKNISCRQIFDKLASIDPEFAFAFTAIRQFLDLLEFVGLQLNPQELMFISSYYSSASAIRYFRFLKEILSPKALIQSIIIKAVEQYDSNFKEFFEAQTAGKDFWKVQEIKKFLQLMETPFSEGQVAETVKQWTKGSKTSIKYNQIYQVFKPFLGMSMSHSNLSALKKNKEGQKEEDGASCLIKILSKLKNKLEDVKNQDLVTFFRKEDLKCNWMVDNKIYKTIRNYAKDKELSDEEIFRKGFLEMERIGAAHNSIGKDIQYISLLRNLEVYEPLELLRLILTQKINEDHGEAFFEKYKKETSEYSGWTIESLKEFNGDEGLDFEQRELRSLFRQLDSDNSGCVETRELFYKLTNIKEFDYQLLIANIKHTLDKQALYLYDMFEVADPRARLVLSNPLELETILEKIGIEISQDHLNQFYTKFSKKNNFEYLVFLRQFYPKEKLFFSAIYFILKEHYKNDFEKLFLMGLTHGKKKWNSNSLMLINQEMVLGFRQAQLKQIWTIFDKNNEQTLTKEEVAQVFNVEIEHTTELQRKTLQNFKDVRRHPRQDDHQEHKNSKPNQGKVKQQSQESLLNELKDVGGKKMIEMAITMINQSETKNGKIQMEHCYCILHDGGVRSSKKNILKLLNKFKELETKKVTINFITFYFYLYDMIYSQDESDKVKSKSAFLTTLIKEIKKMKSISNESLFDMCRKGNKMRLKDFQEIIHNIFEVEVYFQDLQAIWQCWGAPQYLSEEDFDKILQTKEFKGNREQKKQKQRPLAFRQEQKQKSTPFSKLGEQNKMLRFSNNEDEQNGSPKMNKPFSFNEKQQATFRKMNSKRNSQSKNMPGQPEDTPISRFKAQSKEAYNQKQKLPSSKNEAQKKRGGFPQKHSKQEKIQIEEYQDLRRNNKQEKQKEKNKPVENTKYSKNQLISKFRENMLEFGDQFMNELFSRANVIQAKRFVACLNIHYNFDQPEAIFLAQSIANFGKIKLDTIKGLFSSKSPTKQGKRQPMEKIGIKQEKRERWEKSGEKPVGQKKDLPKEDKKLIDPRKQKINVPLVKQSIKSLLSVFSKRFELSELEPFYFTERDSISRQEFINKSQSINPQLSSSICEKIFDYLRPDGHDKVGVLSFKLGMGIDEHFGNEEEDQNYLPQDLQKELKLAFEKADKDHSGFIESNQIQYLLTSLGFNQSIKEIENYFARIDKNFDNKISYPEFRIFIEDQILPQLVTFEEDEEELQELLRDNDIFRQGSIAHSTFQAVIERYGIKLTPIEVQVLVRSLNPDGHDININDFLMMMRQPKELAGKSKAIIYKIKLRKKVYLKQIQKIFQNISSCFVLAYTPSVILKDLMTISTPFRPLLHESGLFYNDLPIKDARKIGSNQDGMIGGEIGKNDILVEMLLKQVSGIPIPQKQEIKNNIVRRYLAISLFDLSSEIIKHAVWNVEAEWDPQQEDVWRFGNNVRSILIKIGGYDARKFEKIVLLFELIISVIQGSKTLEINCGCTNLPLRQLLVPEGKTSKKLKLIAGLPNRSKQIDKNSISKKGGWKNFFGGQIQSELEIQFVHQNKFKEQHRMMAALPAIVIVAKKALNYLWTYRECLGQSAFDGSNLNTFLVNDIKVIVFLLTLDIPELFARVWLWWKQKIEPKIKTLAQGKKVFKVLMQDMYLIVNSKQFQLIKRCPAKPIYHNKPLQVLRAKMIGEVFDNVQSWVASGTATGYKRKKNYNYNYGPLQIQQVSLPREHRQFLDNLMKLATK